MISRVRYMVRELWASLSRNPTLTVAAVITSTVSLFLFGMTLLIQRAFDNQLRTWSGGVEMIVYVKHGAAPNEVELIRSTLEAQATVIENISYCDEACTTSEAEVLFAADPDALTQLLPEMPSMFKLTPVDKDSGDALSALKEMVGKLPNVIDVATPDEQVAALSELKSFFSPRLLVMALVLLFASALLIWNTIRTAMYARRREIEVMKLVGATNWFIRLPFMLEGLLQGVAGGLLGSGFLLYMNEDWLSGMEALDGEVGIKSMVVTDGYPGWVCLAIILLGAFVGAVGSGTAASRFLDV